MYANGTATGVVNLLELLAGFLEDGANGYTRDSLAVDGSGKRYHAHKGSVYVNFRAYVNETPDSPDYNILNSGSFNTNVYSLAFNVGTANGASPWYAQTGTPQQHSTAKYITSGLNKISGSSLNYHFFSQNSGATITVVVEYETGQYQFFSFGLLQKIGTYTGGVYFTGSNVGIANSGVFGGFLDMQAVGFFEIPYGVNASGGRGAVTVDVDGENGWHGGYGGNITTAGNFARHIGEHDPNAFMSGHYIQPNTLNSLHVFRPLILTVDRSTTYPIPRSIIGIVPGVYNCMLNNLAPGQQVTLGSDDFRVFPYGRKASSDIQPGGGPSGHSGVLGFAVKE